MYIVAPEYHRLTGKLEHSSSQKNCGQTDSIVTLGQPKPGGKPAGEGRVQVERPLDRDGIWERPAGVPGNYVQNTVYWVLYSIVVLHTIGVPSMDSVWNPRDQLTVEKDIKLYRGTKTRHGWMIDEDI